MRGRRNDVLLVAAPVADDVAAVRERHGFKLLGKWQFQGSSHKCIVKCCRCRKAVAVCPKDRCFSMRLRPSKIWCNACSQLANERWLKGWPNALAPCPCCWSISTCAGMALSPNEQEVNCWHCGYSWPATSAPWHPEAVARGWRDAESTNN